MVEGGVSMEERMRDIKFYGRVEKIPAECQGDLLVERLRELGEEERQGRILRQQIEEDRFRLACINYARMLRSS